MKARDRQGRVEVGRAGPGRVEGSSGGEGVQQNSNFNFFSKLIQLPQYINCNCIKYNKVQTLSLALQSIDQIISSYLKIKAKLLVKV